MNSVNTDAAELPFEKGKFKISTGVYRRPGDMAKISGVVFAGLQHQRFFKTQYSHLNVLLPDVSTGKAVVLDRGEIVTAIRSSMAIPSIFTAHRL